MTLQAQAAGPAATGSDGKAHRKEELQRYNKRPEKINGNVYEGGGVYRISEWKASEEWKERFKSLPKRQRLAMIRLNELKRIFAHRYGGFLPDDDAGRDDLRLALGVAAFTGRRAP